MSDSFLGSVMYGPALPIGFGERLKEFCDDLAILSKGQKKLSSNQSLGLFASTAGNMLGVIP